jgi:hypothetical protein
MIRALLSAPIRSHDAISRVLFTIPLATTFIPDSDVFSRQPHSFGAQEPQLSNGLHTPQTITLLTALPPFLALSPAYLLRHRGWRAKSVLCIVHC